MKQLTLCLVCLLLGWFAALQFAPSGDGQGASHDSDPSESEEKPMPTEDQAILALEKQLRDKEAELFSLSSELAQAKSVLNEYLGSAEPEEPAPPANPFMDNVKTMAVEMMQTQKQEELTKLKRTLNLTPEQITALESFYKDEAEQESRVMQQMFSGKPVEELQGELMGEFDDKAYFTVSDLLEDILTPEQLETYEANEEKEALEQKEAMAYSQLSQLQRQLMLNEDQKDAVFAIFYEAEHELGPEDWEALEIDHQDPDSSIKYQKAQNERLLDALSEVLTEEQLDLQRKRLDSEMEMQRKAMNMFGEGFFMAPSEQ